MMGHRPYEKYRDGNADGVTSIPFAWTAKRLRFSARLNPSRNEVKLPQDCVVSFVPMDSVGERGGLSLTTERALEEIGTGYTYFADGDVVVAKITPCFENGKGALATGLTNGVALGTTELHVVRAGAELDTRFLFYISISDHFRKIGESEMFGAGGQKRISESFIKDFRAVLPPMQQQLTIVSFLDRETARIDSLLDKKRRLLELLEEKRLAVITHAVTKGLDSKAPIKESGIDWLGPIPVHWKAFPFRRVLRAIEQGVSPVAEDRSADGVDEWGVLKLSAISKGRFLDYHHKTLSEVDDQHRRYEVRIGDLLMTRANTQELVGDVAFVSVSRPRLAIPDLVYRLKVELKKIDPQFAVNWWLSRPGRYQIECDARGTSMSMAKVSQGHIRSWTIAVPPLSEQHAIAREIEIMSLRLNNVSTRIHHAIKLLLEYRSALITDAVTGKIDVRDLVNKNEAAA